MVTPSQHPDPAGVGALLAGARLPMPVRQHPGMISFEERSALHALALHYFDGSGVIVDAGCFLGASTACFGAALQRRSFPASPVIHAYDYAHIFGDAMVILANQTAGRDDFKRGDDFADLLRGLIAPYAPYVDLRLGDIQKTIDEPDPIELLFLDVCKQPAINAIVNAATLPRLIPGRSIVIQQDYVHEWLPWLHMTMGHFADRFRFLGCAGSSGFFLCESAISEDEACFDAWSRLSGDAALEAFDRGIPWKMDPDQAYFIGLAKALLIRRERGEAAALAWLDGVEAPGPEGMFSWWSLPSKDAVREKIVSPNFRFPPVPDLSRAGARERSEPRTACGNGLARA